MLDNGRTISEALMHNLPRAMFIFHPALAAVMKLMYWRPRRYGAALTLALTVTYSVYML